MPQQDNSIPLRWSRGDLVKIRTTAADTWRNAYVQIQRGHNPLLAIPEGMAVPDGARRIRLSLIAEMEPGAYRGYLDGSAYEVTPALRRCSPLTHNEAGLRVFAIASIEARDLGLSCIPNRKAQTADARSPKNESVRHVAPARPARG